MITLMAVVLLAATALCMVPSAEAADAPPGTYADIRNPDGDHTVATGKTIPYMIYASDVSRLDVSYVAKLTDIKGNTVGSVSPTRGSYISDDGTRITVTAPSEQGTYSLTVDFTFTDAEGSKTTVTKTAPVRVVAPIKLSAVLHNNSGTYTDLDVWFVVDGTKIESSKQTVTLAERSTKTITYDYMPPADLSRGEHKVSVYAESGILNADNPAENLISAEESKFFVGQADYSLIEAVMVIVLIVMIIITLFIYRKPVKNVGKPKARR